MVCPGGCTSCPLNNKKQCVSAEEEEEEEEEEEGIDKNGAGKNESKR
jgi:hypothetical protein